MENKSSWPKPGSRIEPVVYDQIRDMSFRWHMSFNDVLNLLLREALSHRRDGRRVR